MGCATQPRHRTNPQTPKPRQNSLESRGLAEVGDGSGVKEVTAAEGYSAPAGVEDLGRPPRGPRIYDTEAGMHNPAPTIAQKKPPQSKSAEIRW